VSRRAANANVEPADAPRIARVMLIPAAVVAAIGFAGLVFIDRTGGVSIGAYVLAVLVFGPWSAGYIAARELERSRPGPGLGSCVASIALAAVLVAAFTLALGIGLLVGAAISAGLGAGAGAGLGLRSSWRSTWSASNARPGPAALSALGWIGTIVVLSAADSASVDDPIGMFGIAIATACLVAATSWRWALAAARTARQARQTDITSRSGA
jgi:hypothetical protein